MTVKYDFEVWPLLKSFAPGISGYVLSPGGVPVFSTIQQAVDAAASSRGTVLLRAGTYTENFKMPPGVELVGDPVDPATVTGCIIVNGVMTPTGIAGRDGKGARDGDSTAADVVD